MVKKTSKKKTDTASLSALADSPEAAEFEKLLPIEITDVFRSSYNKFTNVQVQAGTNLLSFNDVIVESPTGSGKTLAFLLPMFALLKKKAALKKDEFGALIISPSRELCHQIAQVAQPYADKLGLSVAMAVGGTKVDVNLKKMKADGGNILIATPGRLFRLLEMDKDNKIRRNLKSVEILIVDEADRFNETQFELHMKEILAALPKQRRTGLFSATQAKEREDLISFGLRNPKTIKLKDSSNVVSPATLNNFYTECTAAEKVICMLEFIRSKPDKKILVFFPSCSGVRYFRGIFEHMHLKRKLFAIHGRCSAKVRQEQITGFRGSENGVMLSTDVMSRGIDIEDIDWVIQFEIPKHSSWFIHRAGRTARCGRDGNALLILTPQQTAYPGFVTEHEQMEFEKLKVPTSNAQKAQQLRGKIIGLVCKDRELLELGSRAFVSHLESYVKHDCNVVCGLKDLDVPGLAHAYGILRLPKMRELKERTDLDKFQRSDIDTSTIKYANPLMEKNRDKIMAGKHKKKMAVLKKKAQERKEKEKRTNKNKKKERDVIDPKVAKAQKRKAAQEEREEKDDFDNDVKLLRKIKRGRLSQKEMNDVRI